MQFPFLGWVEEILTPKIIILSEITYNSAFAKHEQVSQTD